MTRIAKLSKGYYVNFDDHCLYSKENKKVAEISRKSLEVLEYFCEYPNCYKQINDINQYLEEGCLSSEAIRSRIFKLRKSHPIIKEVVTHNSSGYKYVGKKIEEVRSLESYSTDSNMKDTVDVFIKAVDKYEGDFLKSIMYCSCKWGTCTFDDIPQNTNTCEGALALLLSAKNEKYEDAIDDAIDYLAQECSERGLISKSLDEETVVPTSMFLLLCNKLNRYEEIMTTVAQNLWSVRSSSGWGIYVRDMGKYSNIGCTYWALIGLQGLACVPQSEFQKYLRSLYRYEDSYVFGKTIDDISPRIPSLYATSMMYILYDLLSEDSKKKIGTRYNDSMAIKYIIDNFDNPFFLIEQEGINGIEINGKTSVHTVNWNHISIDYSLTAIASAIEKGALSMDEIYSVLNRILKVAENNNEKNQGLVFWTAPNMSIDRGNRGKMIFPTMHFLMGLSKVRDAVMNLK
jgi:hypothetical protein